VLFLGKAGGSLGAAESVARLVMWANLLLIGHVLDVLPNLTLYSREPLHFKLVNSLI